MSEEKVVMPCMRVRKKQEASAPVATSNPFKAGDKARLLASILTHPSTLQSDEGFWRERLKANVGETGLVQWTGDMERHVKVKFYHEDGTLLLPIECLQKRY